MYRSEIRQALAKLALVSGGAVAGLIEHSQAAVPKVKVALAELAIGSDAGMKNGHTYLRDALAPIYQGIIGISHGMTVIELHELGARFDSVMSDCPALEPFLRLGRQAAAELFAAFELVLQQNKNLSSIVGLLTPALTLGNCYAHYAAIALALAQTTEESDAAETVSIEVEGIDDLDAFADYTAILAHLAREAARALAPISGEIEAGRDIRIESIESGSPIQVKLSGDGKTLRMFLKLLGDAVREVYLNRSPRGRTILAMESRAYAMELGITSPEALSQLDEAVLEAARQYAGSLKGDGTVVSVEGKRIEPTISSLTIGYEATPLSSGEPAQLPPPANKS